MKLLVIGCVLASAYSANLEGLGSDQYFERTPNNNLVQIKYIAVQGGGLYDNRQLANSQRYGNNNEFSNQLNNQVSQDSRFQNQFNNKNERFNEFNQQNQRFNQFSQSFNQENQNFNQQNQFSQFSQQNHGFSGQAEPFSFNNHEFANPNLVEISFDENRHQQFLQNQERQKQSLQNQQSQRQEFQNRQGQRQEFQNQQRQRQEFQNQQRQENQNFNQQNQFTQFSQQNHGFNGQTEQFSFNNHQFANPNLVEVSFDENRHQQFLQNQQSQRQEFQNQGSQRQEFQNQRSQRQEIQKQQRQRQEFQNQQRQRQEIQNQQRQRQEFQNQQRQRQEIQRQQQFSQSQQQHLQQNQFNNQNQLQHFTQTQTQNRNPFFNNHREFQQSSRVQNSNFQNNRVISVPTPERVQSSLIVHGSQIQDQRPSRINHFNNQGIQSVQNQFQHGQGFPSSPMREISGHLQRVDSDEILGIFQPFSIPASASLYEGNVNSQFTCGSQGQGFFADPINNCQQFHVCTRVQGRNTPDLYRFTFQCSEGEYFDQAALSCLRRAGPNSGSCAASPSMYQSSSSRAQQLFNSFSGTPYTPGTTPPGICYLANNAHFVTGIRRK